MRDFKGMKRQRGRNRGGGGGGKPQQNANRAFESNGPDNLKIRGHAQHVFEKYQQLARDATSSGDRVLAENFLQHAEHYFRLLRTLQPNRPYTDIVSREGFVSGYDIDFEDEGDGYETESGGEAGDAGEERDYRDSQPRENRWEARGDQGRGDPGRSDQSRNDQNRSEQGRGDQPRSDAGRNDQNRGGYANGRNNGSNTGRGRDDRNFNRDRNDGQRWENRSTEPRNGDARGEREGGRWENGRSDRGEAAEGEGRQEERRPDRERPERSERYERRDRVYGERQEPARDPLALVEPQAAPLTVAVASAPTSAPIQIQPDAPDGGRRSGARVLRSRDGDVSMTPAFLQGAAPAATVAEDAPVKRPRGRPRKKVEPSPSDIGEA